MAIQRTQELDDFCQLLILGLNAIKKANEMPPYVNSKARDINANQLSKTFKEKLEDTDVLQQFLQIEKDRKICSEEEFRTKASIIQLVRDVKPMIDRLKSGNFKLMLDRFAAAHEFAKELSDLVEDLGVVEETAVS